MGDGDFQFSDINSVAAAMPASDRKEGFLFLSEQPNNGKLHSGQVSSVSLGKPIKYVTLLPPDNARTSVIHCVTHGRD